jgi:hypothetical protein
MSEGMLLLIIALICFAVFAWGMAIKAIARKVRAGWQAGDPEEPDRVQPPEWMGWKEVLAESRRPAYDR